MDFCFEKFQLVCVENWKVSAGDALFRSESGFIPGSLSLCWKFWESVILVGNPKKDEILLWLRSGVRLEQFLAPFSEGEYNGVCMSLHWPQCYMEENHVLPEFEDWISTHISDLVRTGGLLQWDKSAWALNFLWS